MTSRVRSLLAFTTALVLSAGCAPPQTAPTPAPTRAASATEPKASPTPAADAVTADEVVQTAQGAAAALEDVRFEIVQIPQGAGLRSVTAVNVRGSDSSGAVLGLSPDEKQRVASDALLAVAQLFPNALIQLTVRDATGEAIDSGQKLRGGSPNVSVLK